MPPNKDDKKEEEELQNALKQLKLLHIKCADLRSVIPRMLESINSKSNQTPQDVFHEFMRSVQAASNELKEFSDLYKSEESQKVLSRAKKSREANPYGIMPWKAKDHPHWYDLDVDDTP